MAGGSFTTPSTPKGSTATLIPFSPQKDIYQYLRYNTVINRVKDGAELAQRNRQTPARTYKYSYKLSAINTAKLQALLFNPQTYYLPLWEQQQKYVGTISNGSTYIQATGFTVDEYDLLADHYLLIWESENNYELMTITTVNDGTDRVDFTSATSAGDFTNPLIIPVFKAILLGQPTWEQSQANDFYITELDFMLLYSVAIDTFTPTKTYDSTMVLLPPNYFDAKTQSGASNPLVKVMDNDLGEFSYFKNVEQGMHISSWGFYAQGRSDIYTMITKLNYFNGQQRAVWIPTLKRDFEPESDIGNTDTVIDIKHKNLNIIYDSTDLDRVVMLYLNGSYYIQDITDITEVDSDTERLTLTTTFGVDVDISEDEFFICWLFKGCINEDQIDIHHFNHQAKAMVNFRELQV